MGLTEDLEHATEVNNQNELNKILKDLNEMNFLDYKSLMKQIRVQVKELDPFEPENTVNYILDNIRPDLKKLIDPVHMILSSSTSRPRWFHCFRGTRT